MLRKARHYKLAIAYDLLLTFGVPLNIVALFLSSSAYGALSAKQAGSVYLILIYLYWAVVIILGVMNIVISFRKYREGDDRYCVNALLILKYGLVIFFIVNYLSGILIFMAALVGTRGIIIFAFPVVFFVIFISMAVTWCIMIPGSFYGIQVIRFAVSQGKITGIAAAVHGILQFIFLGDVLDTLYLAVSKWGMGKKSSIIVGGLYILAVSAMIATAVYIGTQAA